jgi:hypothetical protein
MALSMMCTLHPSSNNAVCSRSRRHFGAFSSTFRLNTCVKCSTSTITDWFETTLTPTSARMQLEVCDLPWCDFVCFFAATESFRVWRVYRSRLHWRWMEAKLARFLEALDNDIEPAATDFPAVFREAIDLARGTATEAPSAALRPHLPPKVHCVDVLSARCQLVEIDWYIEKRRIAALRSEFEARATSATEPMAPRSDLNELVVAAGDDPSAGLSAIRAEFDKNVYVWNESVAMFTSSSPPPPPPPRADSSAAALPPLPDWLQPRRSPRQVQQYTVASPARHVRTMRNAAWFRAQAPPPVILVLALAAACAAVVVIALLTRA